jgi:hypothetical protein
MVAAPWAEDLSSLESYVSARATVVILRVFLFFFFRQALKLFASASSVSPCESESDHECLDVLVLDIMQLNGTEQTAPRIRPIQAAKLTLEVNVSVYVGLGEAHID